VDQDPGNRKNSLKFSKVAHNKHDIFMVGSPSQRDRDNITFLTRLRGGCSVNTDIVPIFPILLIIFPIFSRILYQISRFYVNFWPCGITTFSTQVSNFGVVSLPLNIYFTYFAIEIEMSKNSFRVYRQVQKTSQKNHIKLRFKTIHSTGLIMFVQGANKRDYLSLELYRGKIR